MKVAPAIAALCLAAIPAASAELLPEISVQLRAARYVPARTDFHWQGWIGAGAGLVRVRDTTVYFDSDVETILGDTLRTVDPNQAAYHLEAGIRQRAGRGTATLFFHHVSRHYVDRAKTQAVDWNVLGGRVWWPVRTGPRPVRAMVSVGHTTLESLVGYKWEVIVEIEAEPAHIGSVALFLRTNIRLVTVEENPEIARGSFADASFEAGPRWDQDGRRLELFAAVERRNDVYLEVPGHQDRALFGFRISYLR